MRFCMPAITLRSNQTINIVATRPTTKMTTTFSSTMHHVAERQVVEQRVECQHQNDSTRTSVTTSVESISSPMLGPGWLNGTHAEPRTTVSSATTVNTIDARLLVTLTSAPSVDADALEVERVQVQLRARGEVSQRRRLRSADGVVVQLATDDEPVVVAVAFLDRRRVSGGSRQRALAHDAVARAAQRSDRGRAEPGDVGGDRVGEVVDRATPRGRHRAGRRARRRSSSRDGWCRAA